LHDWNAARVAAEAIGTVYPPVHELVHRLKLRFYGPLPQVRRAEHAAIHAVAGKCQSATKTVTRNSGTA
jgi:hypothetical protein